MEDKTSMEYGPSICLDQPRCALSVVENQKRFQWTNSNDFYSMLPAPYMTFYQSWVRQWLYWYDGYVPWVHGGQNGLLSTSIGTVIVNRAADSVFGGGIMFANARIPTAMTERGGKPIGSALDFIANDWAQRSAFKSKLKRAGKDAFGGGFSLLKLNKANGELWVDELRADRFYLARDSRGKIEKCVCFLSLYDDMTPVEKGGRRYYLVEERRFEKIGLFENEIPVVEYKVYANTSPIQYFSANRGDNSIKWEDLPKAVKTAFRHDYDFKLNVPQAMNGFKSLGVYYLQGSDDISNVPQIGLGESLLANIMTYLYEYDFYNTCFNTDMYLARGRVVVPEYMQSPQAAAGNQPRGLDSFLYTKYPSNNVGGEENKPEAIQFELRAQEWREARNMLLECMATSIGLSVSTLASYIQDGSNRTAREISAEESATALFVENARRRFEQPANELLSDVLRFYGYSDDVEIRWSKSGLTNMTVLVDTLSKAVQAGLISRKKAHAAFNFDDDEEQNNEDYAIIEKEEQERAQRESFSPPPFNDINY